MLVKCEAGFDVWDLFIHDRYSTGAVDEAVVAELLEREMNDRIYDFYEGNDTPHIRVLSPDDNGLSRFTMVLTGTEERLPRGDRPYTKKDVYSNIPKWLHRLLNVMNAVEAVTHDGDHWEVKDR